MRKRLAMLALAGPLIAGTASGQTIVAGDGELSATVDGTPLNVFTYRPASCSPRQLLVVFHGVGRDAGPYRTHARALADHLCALVIAPEFDARRFPNALYQMGGSTIGLVAPLVAWARTAAGQPDMRYMLIGHSAGAQFLGRVAAYGAPAAARIVIANPSTWVMPDTTIPVPYGFGDAAGGEAALRSYLALPIVVLLGGDDTGSHNLSMTSEAMAQGATRLARGRHAFEMARSVAQQHGWPFGWTLVEVPGVGHDAAKMLSAPQTLAAFGTP